MDDGEDWKYDPAQYGQSPTAADVHLYTREKQRLLIWVEGSNNCNYPIEALFVEFARGGEYVKAISNNFYGGGCWLKIEQIRVVDLLEDYEEKSSRRVQLSPFVAEVPEPEDE